MSLSISQKNAKIDKRNEAVLGKAALEGERAYSAAKSCCDWSNM